MHLNNPKVDSRRSSQDFGRIDKLISASQGHMAAFFPSAIQAEGGFSIAEDRRPTTLRRSEMRSEKERIPSRHPFKVMRSSLKSLVAPVKSKLFDRRKRKTKKFIKSSLIKKRTFRYNYLETYFEGSTVFISSQLALISVYKFVYSMNQWSEIFLW